MILCHFETFHYRANIILIYRQICLTLPWHIAGEVPDLRWLYQWLTFVYTILRDS
ncbi:hypothetical protein SAMN06296036_14720 [Pseudobacteriovorax antillogorgiicola]|uniref:Uncharacterized protein n=1 Tax=Pseudobacteriovorax antillogorgiicola TaxID=1513793 RepID=A0A1Y6CXJ7_9BACT|nr:hypothetical protein EDD56_1461 [Pseudobacteriovorax antillogorgiicola]SMF83523.1 hypothetical protein SAMN06296036_14720 [Pseudobacteriovorax antillogorgiicola]